MDDLHHAITAAEMAVNTTTKDASYEKATRLNNLGLMLEERASLTGSMDDFNRAVDMINTAIDISHDESLKATLLSNLGHLLTRRSGKANSMDDLQRAIKCATAGIEKTPMGHLDRPSRFNNLGIMCAELYDLTTSMEDLDRAIDATKTTIQDTPKDHYYQASHQLVLGELFSKKFERTGSRDDLMLCLSSHADGRKHKAAAASVRIHLALCPALEYIAQKDWEQSSTLLQASIETLPEVNPRLLRQTDRRSVLKKYIGMGSMAAAAALNAGKPALHALQLLESGRGIISSMLMDMRGDISELEEKHLELASEFKALTNVLDGPESQGTFLNSVDGINSWEREARRRRESEQQFNYLLTRIRSQSGFDKFQLPPEKEDMMAAASHVPIAVINFEPIRSDAFLIERD